MKKLFLIAMVTSAVLVVSCSDVKRTPGKIYMPDMAYSRAYETYADHTILADSGIHYTAMPVAGTVARGVDMPFHIALDAAGDTTNYTAAKLVKSPYDSLPVADLKEAERLYLINCAICHGPKLDGNGPLYNDGKGPYPVKPIRLAGDPKYDAMPEGQMFYSVTYGKNLMGSYASQLSRKQRWMVIKYIKNKQAEGKATVTTPAAAGAAAVKP